MIKNLIKIKELQFEKQGYIQFSAPEIEKLSESDINHLEQHFKGRGFMLLPQSEIDFFEWLKQHDRPVWDDLWEGEDLAYIVSINFLNHFIGSGNGFPICDLIHNDNYWFSKQLIKAKGREKMLTIDKKLSGHKKLTVSELLLLEIMQNSIDIWHFCYRYKLAVKRIKDLVEELHRDDVITHLKNRDDLTRYIDF